MTHYQWTLYTLQLCKEMRSLTIIIRKKKKDHKGFYTIPMEGKIFCNLDLSLPSMIYYGL